ncbi:MAG: precorrin-3B C(17)-methyltransferase [Oscillatoria sp. SIO1A7]|nr:precorrin-3B C(17)-methyltransferase [Oscillatoria sp. SIO1A7]
MEVIQEAGSTLWQQHLPENHSFYFQIPESDRETDLADNLAADKLSLATDNQSAANQSVTSVNQSAANPSVNSSVTSANQSAANQSVTSVNQFAANQSVNSSVTSANQSAANQSVNSSVTSVNQSAANQSVTSANQSAANQSVNSSVTYVNPSAANQSVNSSVTSVNQSAANQSAANPSAANPSVTSVNPSAATKILIGFAGAKLASNSKASEAQLPTVQWYPRVLWVGIGCERGTSKAVMEKAIAQVFQANNLAEEAIAGIATIDLKADEVGLLELCQERDLPLRVFSAERLRSLSVPTPSEIVNKEVGTPSVAEAAAILAALEAGSAIVPVSNPNSPENSEQANDGQNSKDPNDSKLTTQNSNLLITKQIFRLEGQPGAATIAVSRGEREYTGREGKLLLVGIGPGQLEQMTPAAQMAITGADAIIGYSLYINLISSLLRPGQIVESLPIAWERQRAERAIALANWGLTVAVVSSGDAGIYGMAGLVFEQLRAQNWDGKTPGVEVFPGITALQAAASRLGAPLMHDFCAISLSDLLTPWPVIEKRLEAAARGDFVTALYNPRSQTRTEQISVARQIFLQHRDAQTPVAIARSVYRERELITITTLEKMLDFPIDMLSTVLIGNQSTGFYENWLITPRGYLS